MKSIEIVVARDGEITVAAKGYKGPACEKATKAMLEALGAPGETKRTLDFYAMPEPQVMQRR